MGGPKQRRFQFWGNKEEQQLQCSPGAVLGVLEAGTPCCERASGRGGLTSPPVWRAGFQAPGRARAGFKRALETLGFRV